MPTKAPAPELLPFLDALAELLANQVIKDLQSPAEDVSLPHVPDAQTPSDPGMSDSPKSRY